MAWLKSLKEYAERHPLAILRFTNDEWESLVNSRRGVAEFTIARPHHFFDDVKVPAPCLLFGKSNGVSRVCFGLLASKSTIATLDTRIKVSRSVFISPSSESNITKLVEDARHAKNWADRLREGKAVTLLSPKLSSYLIDRLATIDANHGAMRVVAEVLTVPKRFKGNVALQESAVNTALAAFGLTGSDQASTVDLVSDKPTALARVAIMEDSVIEHDARSVPGFDLIASDVTGRAVFRKGDEQLEVFTANRRELEHCLGVDLIYVNLTKQNLVMLQYKMLKPAGKRDEQTDWVYRPDLQLDKEIARMKLFANQHMPSANEYRLNPQILYMKFVKNDAAMASGGIIIPLEHFEKIRVDLSFKGPNKGLRLSYRALNGQYLRHEPFIDLIRCGYIGAHAPATAQLRVLIGEILKGNKAVVAAIQQPVSSS